MAKPLSLLLLLACPLWAESVTTEAVGFNKVTCLANSDTIVGVPLRVQGSISSKLSAAPVINGDFATLTLAHNALPGLTKHYLKFNGGTRDGRWYDITANTANTVTIDLNSTNPAAELDGVLSGNSVLIAEYWTLNTLFPPAQATTDPLTTGHAIVGSAGTSLRNRKTQILLPDLVATGINLAPSKIYYIDVNNVPSKEWKDASSTPQTNAGETVLFPDSYLIIRHPAMPSNTQMRILGEAEFKNLSIALRTIAGSAQDCFVSIPRPVPVRLDQLSLHNTPAFVSSAGTSLRNRKDQLLVFDNQTALINKSPSKIYYFNSFTQSWTDTQGDVQSNNAEIAAGAGFVIRKAQSASTTVFWNNTPTYIP